MELSPAKSRVIICGLGQVGCRIFSILKQQGILVTGISDSLSNDDFHWEHSDDSDLLRESLASRSIVVGNLRSEKILLEAGIKSAKTLLLACSDDALNLSILTHAKVLNPSIYIVNRLFNSQLGERLDQTIANHISMSVSSLVAPIFAFAAIQRPVIGQLNLLDKTWPVTSERIVLGHPLYNKSLSALWNNPNRLLLTYEPAKNPTSLMSALQSSRRLEHGDRLIWAQLEKAKSQRWSFRGLFHNIQQGFQQFRRLSRAMIVILLILLATISLAIAIYVSSDRAPSLVDALYFSVGMITGAGGQESVVENSTAPVKIFTAVMMLVGAGVIGIFYALLNDYILGTHLQQIWMTTRAPKSGHRIICGLGGVGFRTLDLLKTLGEDLVALECDSKGKFVKTARSRNIPIIIGNAAVPDVLELANVAKAASLLAVTSNDATNLEIAITAKSMAPTLPVVVRIKDPQFARQVQQVFKFDGVISPTDLTAPAFAAAAIGGRILGNYTASDGLWLAIASLITPAHPLCLRELQEAASTEGFTPLYAERNQQLFRGRSLLNMTLTSGVTLYLMMPAHRWESLWTSKAQLPYL
ncbi:MAG: NAD(P)-binding protein [Cyanobacteria bacterium J06627_32]